jgi:hypothetical protein
MEGSVTDHLKHLTVGSLFDLTVLRIKSDHAKQKIELDMVADRVSRGLGRFPSNLEPDYGDWNRKLDGHPDVTGYENAISSMSLPARIELTALFWCGDQKRNPESWEETIDRSVEAYASDDPNAKFDHAFSCAHSRDFADICARVFVAWG